MKEIIVVAGENKLDVGWLRRCLREQGYSSIPCKTAEQILEELNVLPTCGTQVPLVVIDPELLRNVSDGLITQLSECALDVPFILFDGTDVQADLEVFEQICEYRMRFVPQQSPLADVLEGAGLALDRD